MASIILKNGNMAKRRSTPMSDQLRKAITKAEYSRYRLSKETGIDQSVLSKFVRGERGISLEAIDKLGEFLNLQIVNKNSQRKKGK